MKNSLVARAVKNFAEGYFLIPCFPLKQVRPHTSDFFPFISRTLESISPVHWKVQTFECVHLFTLLSASSLMSLAVSKSTFPAVGAVSLKLQTSYDWSCWSFLQVFAFAGLRDYMGQKHFWFSTASAKALLGMSPMLIENLWTLTSCWRLLLSTSANIPPDWLMGHILFKKNPHTCILKQFLFWLHPKKLWWNLFCKMFLGTVLEYQICKVVFSSAQSPDSECLVVNKSGLVSWLYSAVTSGLADVLEVFLNLYWKCSIHNVVICTLHVFRYLDRHCHFPKCWSVPYIFLSYRKILNQNMLMSFMALFMLVAVWFYFSNIIIITCDRPFGWMFGFGLATEWSSVLIKSNRYHLKL